MIGPRMQLDDVRDCPILALWVSPWLENDGIFDPLHPENRDDENYGLRDLRQKMMARGWRVHTHDVVQRAGLAPAAVLFFDIPRRPVASLIGAWAGKSRVYSLLVESPLVKPYIWERKRHGQFDAIFTWHSDLAKEKGFVEICLGFHIDPQITLDRNVADKQKLCVMIAGNKRPRIRSALDLYAQRVEAIRWFETFHPADFDLYGVGWNDASIRFAWRLRRMGLMGIINRVLRVEPRPSWKGPVKEKLPVLKRYRFNIAFENVRDIPGYITEKIFDTFLAGCVPVYWGAPNVTDFIPADCFIDFRTYGNFEALYARLSTMSDAEYLGYIDRIEAFLRGPAADPFRAEYLSDTLTRHIAG